MEIGGLTTEEAKRRAQEHGKNELEKKKKTSVLKLLLGQFTSPLIILLIVSAIVLGFVSHFSSKDSSIDIILILVIVVVSGLSGFIQDYKAEKSIEALQKMADPKTKVFRDSKIKLISTRDVVVGDILILEEGDVIAADSKVLESNVLRINEASLTGESMAVGKKIQDSVYMGTYVASGNAKAEVTEIGMNTKIGHIAHQMENIEEEKTPFYLQMDKLGKKLFWIVIIIAISTAAVGLFKYNFVDAILIAIALAVAAIPEGLPAVLVLSLAVGSKVMMKNNALVRRLSVIESIGSVNYICADKTGTITEDKMSVTKIYSDSKKINLSDIDKKKIDKLILCGILNNNSKEIFDKELKVVGDETDIAIRNFGESFDYLKKDLDKEFNRVFEVPFDSKRKMVSVVVSSKNKETVYSKGAPESIVEKCNSILIGGEIKKLTDSVKKEILFVNDEFASDGLRVIGFAYKEEGIKHDSESVEKDLIFLGLEAIRDSPRKGVKEAISQCRTAGINVLMLTGDNPLTAKMIAREVGIKSKKVLTGLEIEKIQDEQLYSLIDSGARVFARLTPEHKLRIMTLLQKKENIVAMTGDGVNDSLALKKADVGVAMGIRGTDVAKQSSDLILLDDNFVTIVSAIKEGRRIFENIRKFTNYLLTSNFAEVAVVFLATLFLVLKNPLLLPIQILWINLLTDGVPALALGADPARKEIMNDPPRRKSESVLSKRIYWLTGTIGTMKSVILFATFFAALYFTRSNEVARTAIFTGFILYEFVRVAVIRSQEKLGWFSNMFLFWALVLSVVLQLVIIYTPLNKVFGIVPLGVTSWIILLSGVLVGYFLAIWITKFIAKRVKN